MAQFSVGGRSVPGAVIDAVRGRMRAGPFDMAALCSAARASLQEHLLPTGTAHMVADKVIDSERRHGRVTKVAVESGTKRATWVWEAQ